MEECEDFEMKDKLREALKVNGVESSLKTQLRLQLVRLFQSLTNATALKQEQKEGKNEETIIADSIIAEHLRKTGRDATLSVFISECGDILPANPPPFLFSKTVKTSALMKSKTLLLSIVSQAIADSNTTITEEEESEGLEGDSATTSTVGMSQRLNAFRKRIEEEAEKRASSKAENFIRQQIDRIKSEEQEKCKEEMSKLRMKLEFEQRERMSELSKRENESSNSLRMKEQERSKMEFEQRQRVLDQMDRLKQKEVELRRENEIAKTELREREERLASREADLDAKLLRLEKERLEIRKNAEDEFQRLRQTLEQKLELERNAFIRERARSEKEILERSSTNQKQQRPQEQQFPQQQASEEVSKLKKLVKKLKEKIAQLERDKSILCQLHDDEIKDIQETCRDEVTRNSMEWQLKVKEIDNDRKVLEEELEEKESTISLLQRENNRLKQSNSANLSTAFKRHASTLPRQSSGNAFQWSTQTISAEKLSASVGIPSSSLANTMNTNTNTNANIEQLENESDFVEQELRRAREETSILERETAKLSQRASMVSILEPTTAPSTSTTTGKRSPIQQQAIQREEKKPTEATATTTTTNQVKQTSSSSWLDDSRVTVSNTDQNERMAKEQQEADRIRKEREAQAMKEIREAEEAQKREREREKEQQQEAEAALDDLEKLDI